MARLGASKKKKSPHTADPRQIKKELKRVTEQLESRDRERIGTSEILRVIANSSADAQSVLDTIAKNAAQLCESADAQIYRLEGDTVRKVAVYGDLSPGLAVGETRSLSGASPSGRAILDRQVVHVHDMLAQGQEDYSDVWQNVRKLGVRTGLAVPLMRNDAPIGAITVRRTELRPFTDNQIALLKTFADQAVIAIENARLFQELKESLEQQTATSEILGVIASSPTDIQPVLDVVAENAAKLCEATDASILRVDGDILRLVASYGALLPIAEQRPLIRAIPGARAIIDRQTIHVPDLQAQVEEFPPEARTRGMQGGTRTVLATPLFRKHIPIGAIVIRRTEVKPFTDKQIALLKTFADQAVIAIENVRLFQELKESLEQQTATSEILGVIASSPTDLQPVLDAIAQSAARVCGSDDATIRLVEGNEMILAAHFGTIPPPGPGRGSLGWRSVGNEALLQRRTIHIPDLQAEAERFPDSSHIGRGIRTFLVTPLLREGTAIGVIAIRRKEVKPFTDKQVALLETFASQAVIAIENVRLFKELQERNRDLTEALEQQTATSEILRVIAGSPTDLQPVFQTIIANAARLCEAQNGAMFRFDGEVFHNVALYNVSPAMEAYAHTPIRPGRESALRRVGLEKRPAHIPDMLADPECVVSEVYKEEGMRTALAVPLLKENELIGAIAIHRREVRPFTENQIKLVSTFADQAVIAIENVRLFQELKESLEQQTATSEILGRHC